VTFGVYVAGRISGAHLNPAVTITLAAFQGFPWRKVAPYCLAQTVGAFIAALLIRANYADLLAKFDPGHTFKSQIVFSTLPGNGAEGVSVATAFLDQVIGTAILLFLIFALVNAKNNPPLANLAPVAIGFVVVAIGMAFGANAGYAINPARDFGPRLASFLTGYAGAWNDQYGQPYFWLPIVAPIIGGLIGGGLFQVLINRYLPAAEAEPAPVGRDIPR
jgi:glycerol uptake facilitator protein